MKILLLAPHPFFQARGTPIAVDLLARTLAAQGHSIDLLTYHEGSDPSCGHAVMLHRIPASPLARNIKPGFSMKKLLCDWFMLRKALRMAKDNRYDIVHAVEESVFMAMLIRKRFGVPYVFDMDSSMPQQMADKLFFLWPFLPLMRRCERAAVRAAAAVVPMCDSLAETARRYGARKIVVLRDVSLLNPGGAPGKEDLRQTLNIRGTCLMYVGNLERYQGIDLLLGSFADFASANREATLVVAGGTDEDVGKYTKKADKLGIRDRVRFTGHRPLEEMPALFAAADILVSPRIKGTNTPMKLYSYLHSGKAVLATDIPSHTQVLGSETAMLAAPRRREFAAAMRMLAQDAALRDMLGRNGKALVEEKYSRKQFAETVRELYDGLSKIVSGQLPRNG